MVCGMSGGFSDPLGTFWHFGVTGHQRFLVFFCYFSRYIHRPTCKTHENLINKGLLEGKSLIKFEAVKKGPV